MSLLHDKIEGYAKSLMFLSIGCFFLFGAWLAYTNPMLNYNVEKQEAAAQERLNAAKKAETYEWTHFLHSDVNVSSDQYPIVVLRTGFKVIKLVGDQALIGWKYEVVNTSPENNYFLTIDYDIQDDDGFSVTKSTKEELVTKQEYSSVQATVMIDQVDIPRLAQASWTIRLSPGWQSKESKTKGARYERLSSIIKDTDVYIPFWVYQYAAKEKTDLEKRLEGEKWQSIREAYDLTKS